jgi:integrase
MKKGKTSQEIKTIKITNSTQLDDVIEHALQIKCAGLGVNTIIGHIKKSNQIKGWVGHYKVGEFRENEWLKFESKLLNKYASDTIKNLMEIINPTIILLINGGFLTHNPLGRKKISQSEKSPPKVFDINDISRLIVINKSQETEILLVQFGLLTGLRIGELLALNKEGFDKENNQYLVDITLSTNQYKDTKNKASKRTVDLCNNAVCVFEKLIELAASRPILNIDVSMLNNRDIIRYARTMLAYNSKRQEIFKHVDHFTADFFKAHCESRSINYLPPSNLRHTFATQLLIKGTPIKFVAKQMGHKTKEINEKYDFWIREDAKEAYDKVDGKFNMYVELPDSKAANDEFFAPEKKQSYWSKLFNKIFRKAS